MPCDMCGKGVGDSDLFFTKVEGTMLRLCKGCCKYGKVLKKVRPQVIPREQPKFAVVKSEDQIEEMIVEDYANKIKFAREGKGIKQEDFAKQINEKESLIHNIETGHMEPNIKLAKKIEKKLGIKLVEEVELRAHESPKSSKKFENLTIGDLIKIKKD